MVETLATFGALAISFVSIVLVILLTEIIVIKLKG